MNDCWCGPPFAPPHPPHEAPGKRPTVRMMPADGRLRNVYAHAARWKALARRLRERLVIRRRLISGMAGLQDLLLKAEYDLEAARESHARELMESAQRYGAQIERLQRERDDYRDLLQEEMRLHSATLAERNDAVEKHVAERRSHDETLKCSERYLRERDQEREAHAESKRRDAAAWGNGEAEFWETVKERDALAERVRVLEGALERISKILPCDSPCDMSEPDTCGSCGHAPSRSACTGCIARAALEAKGPSGG